MSLGDILQLKSLHIAGFKSFARPAELEFPPGITAFVGANGSGKSNIVDAVRWCLGEQNARDLRGQRAEDVIHAGRRRVLGSAEVSLAFEGDTEAETEIQVSRRLMRSGESDYLINGARRRLRDVQTTLSSLGMDHPRFVVVTQGMTDFLLSATAAERRALLEQAAGLSSYRHRRDEASGKLAAAEQNMVTAEAVLAELEPRIRALQRQVRAIEARDDLVQRLKERQALWYSARRRDLRTELDDAHRGLLDAESQRRDARERLDALERQAEQAIEREREWQRRVEVASAALHLAQRELDANTHRIATADVHIADARRRCEAIRSRLELLGAEIEGAEDRRRSAVETVGQARAQLAALGTAEAQAAVHVRGLESRVDSHNQVLAEVRAEAARRRDDANTARKEARDLEAELEELKRQSERLSAIDRESHDEVEALRAAEVTHVSDTHDAAEALRSTAARCEEQGALVRRSEERLQRAQRLQTELGQQMRSATAAEERLKRAFAALEAQMAATALGRLYVTGGAERAIDIALGPWRTEAAPVTPQLDDFVTWREQVRAHFPPGAAWADELVDSRDPVPAVLLGTVVVRDLGEAEALWETLATLEAHRIGSPAIQVATRDGGLVTAYGSRSHAEDDLGIRYLATRTELAHLAAERRRLSRNEARVGRLVSRLHELHDAHRSSLTAALRAADIEQQRNAKLQAEWRVIEARRSRLEREIEERSRALSTVSGRCASVDAALREKLQVLNGLEREEAEARSVVPQAETAVAEVQTALAEARRQVEALASDRAILAKRAQAHEELAATAGVEVDRLRAEPARLESELLATEEELERLDGELRALQGQRGQLAAAAVECEKRLAEVRVDRPQSLQEGRELRRARDASDQALARHERAAARRDEVVAAGRRLEHEIQQEMEGAELYDVEMAPDDIPTEEEIRRLRARAAQYADYDPAILTEYAEMCERRRYLTSQIGDLKSTAEGLREIMTVADAEMRVRFASALGRVGDEFNRVFTGMLRGGEARLEQSEDGGVEVRASLPGKRTRSSASFSGGERALVASALLFGVLRIRPAPFCVLDEVDAALDETNVDRYLEALRDLSQRMQVLVVTHNRATMAAATALYGLTMDSDGASSLLSLRLDQYDAVS